MSGRLVAILIAVLALLGGGYYLLSTGQDGAPEVAGPEETGPKKPLGPALRVERASPTRASGSVRAAGGDALGGAVVVLRPLEDEEAEPLVARTDDAGAWTVDEIPSGRYAASATHPGYLAKIVPSITLKAEQENAAIDFVLEGGGNRLHGTVADLTGGEVEGALVRVTPVEGFLDVRELDGFGTVTNEAGEYTLSVADGPYRISVSHADYTTAGRTISVEGGDRKEDFQLTPMAVVEGVVVRDEDGKPVPGARVLAASERTMVLPGGGRQTFPGNVQSVTADEAGRFRIRGLEPGTLTLRARAEGLASAAPETLTVGVAEQVGDVELRVGKAFSVRGQVIQRGDDPRPIAGATVRAMVPNGVGGSQAETDDEGNFALHGLLAGQYRLMASSPGHLPAFPGTSVSVESDLDGVELELDPGEVLRGRVEPPEAAKVALEMRPENMQMGMGMFMLGGGVSTVADEDGAFELKPVGKNPMTIVARAADGRVGELAIDLSQGVPTEEVVVQLEERARVEGRVVNARGEPVAGATVSLKQTQSGPSKVTLIVNGRDMGASAAPTAEDGSFAVVGLEGGTYEVNVTDSHGQPLLAPAEGDEAGGPLPPLEVNDGERKTSVTLTVDAADGEISGVVKTADGEPASDVWVTLMAIPKPMIPGPRKAKGDGDDGEIREERTMMMVVADGGAHGGGMGSASFPPALTDDRGAFTFTGLRDGDYVVTAEQGGGRSRVSEENVKPGTSVTLTLAPLAAIEGKVTQSGKTIDGAMVTVSGPTQRASRVSKGRFEVDGLDPGKYSVTVRTGQASQTKEVVVKAGETADVELVLEPWATITGTVVDTDGKAIAGARIMIGAGSEGRVELEMDGSEPDIRTKDDGTFEAHAPSGKRVLLVMDPESPAPIAMKFFVAQGGEEQDLGEIKQDERMAGGRMVMEGGENEDVEVEG